LIGTPKIALVALSALKQGISQYPPRKSAASGSGAEAEESGPQPKLQRDVVSFENIGHASPRLPWFLQKPATGFPQKKPFRP
jgi:hypothetical protein